MSSSSLLPSRTHKYIHPTGNGGVRVTATCMPIPRLFLVTLVFNGQCFGVSDCFISRNHPLVCPKSANTERRLLHENWIGWYKNKQTYPVFILCCNKNIYSFRLIHLCFGHLPYDIATHVTTRIRSCGYAMIMMSLNTALSLKATYRFQSQVLRFSGCSLDCRYSYATGGRNAEAMYNSSAS